jgi:MHS family proline/betaine transporter-like MFS transporter
MFARFLKVKSDELTKNGGKVLRKQQGHLRVLATTSIGAMLEWYDFAVFAYLAPVISELFFPRQNHFWATMNVYLIFAIGLFVRPLGSIIIGHFGDTIGRKKVLLFSIVLISAATTGIGFLPTYETIGVFAPLLLLLLRILQGFSVGGETTGSITFALETYYQKNRGFIGAFILSFVGNGILLGSLAVIAVQHYCSHQQLYTWGWRIPFLAGILTGVVGYFLRVKIAESSFFSTHKMSHRIEMPFKEVIIKHRYQIVQVTGLFALSALIFYSIFMFMPEFVSGFMHIPLDTMNVISIIALGILNFFIPLGGFISDKIGRKTALLIGCLGFVVLSYPLYKYLSLHSNLTAWIIVQATFVLLAIIYLGPISAAAQEIPSTGVRYTVTAIGYNLSNGFIGGTAPIVISGMIKLTHSNAFPGIYLTAIAILAFVVIFFMKETAMKALE